MTLKNTAPMPIRLDTPEVPDCDTYLSRFGSCEVLEEIGRGGMGIVYRARRRVPDRCVALKMIRPALRETAADVQRFRTEGESAARLDHPNIVPIYEIGECDGQLHFSVKLCCGGNQAAHAADGRHSRSRSAAGMTPDSPSRRQSGVCNAQATLVD